MRSNPGAGLLIVISGAAIGALIGLALIKLVSPWCIPAGAVVGGVIGMIIVSSPSGPYARGYSDDGDVAATGCMVLGCLGDLFTGLSCLRCSTMILAAIGGSVLFDPRSVKRHRTPSVFSQGTHSPRQLFAEVMVLQRTASTEA